MSLESSDIHGTTGANFTFTISSGTITKALLQVSGQQDVKLTVDASGRVVTVSSLPAGNSGVRLDLVWAPQDPDALVDVGTVTTGTAVSAPAKGILTAGDTPGLVRLFGTGA
jgi:hypothetical protein